MTRLRLEGRLSEEGRAWLRRLGQVAAKAGANAYLVGGPVRDLILGCPAPDTDLAVEGSVEAAAEALARELGGRVKKTTDFLTATVVLADECEIDVAHTRTETYAEPGALPEVSPASLGEDLRRRDFTVNAMALSLAPAELGQLIDPHGGYADLRAGLLRVLHERSFEDDPTRMLRAARFRERLGLRLEPETRDLLARAAAEKRLEPLSGARLAAELRRLLSEHLAEGFEALQELGLLDAMGLPQADADSIEHMRLLPAAVEVLGEEMGRARPMAMCLGLYAATGPELDAGWLGERLTLDAGERRDLEQSARLTATPPGELSGPSKDSDLYFALQNTTVSGAAACWTGLDRAGRARLERYWRELRCITADVDGQDLIAAGHDPGPDFSTALRCALAAKIDGGADRQEQLEAALAALAASGMAPGDGR